MVKTGQALAWMSSTDRAALMDAARDRAKISSNIGRISINHRVTGAYRRPGDCGTIQPGQTVTTADAVVVLSDALIVRAQVDETISGRLRAMKAMITWMPIRMKNKAKVEHIYMNRRPLIMSPSIWWTCSRMKCRVFPLGNERLGGFYNQEKENVLLLPVDAVYKDKGADYALVVQVTAGSRQLPVTLGFRTIRTWR